MITENQKVVYNSVAILVFIKHYYLFLTCSCNACDNYS